MPRPVGFDPYRPYGGVMAQHHRTVWARTARVEEPRHELVHASFVRVAESGAPAMVMSMYMQDCNGFAVGDLEDLAERTASDTGANVIVIDVVLIRHGVPSLAKKQQAGICEHCHAAGEKANPLGC